jgi:hypothetical protein
MRNLNFYVYMEKYVYFVPNHLFTKIINNARHFRFFNARHKKKKKSVSSVFPYVSLIRKYDHDLKKNNNINNLSL